MSREATEYASDLFRQGKEVTGKKPRTLITDGLKAYHLAYKREFFSSERPRTEHLTWQDDGVDNRKMESFNGNTVRVREKVMRSLKTEDSPILDGYANLPQLPQTEPRNRQPHTLRTCRNPSRTERTSGSH